MPVICLPNCAFLSETSRMIAVYKRLCEIDVPVIMAAHGGTYEFALKDEKIPYRKIEPFMSHEDCLQYLNSVNKPWKSVFSKSSLIKYVKSEIELFRSNKADAVITGFNLSSALSARYLNIPLVVTHLGSYVPPALEKGMFVFSECFDNLFTHFISEEWVNKFFTKLFPHLPFQLKLFNSVADEIGIKPVRSFFDLMMGDLTLVTDVPEILGISEKEMEEWKPSDTKFYRSSVQLKYAGPIFARLFSEIPEEVYKFLNTEKPKIYVAMASGNKKDLQQVYDILSEMDVRAVFCSLVHNNTFSSSDKILVVDFLPSHLVMPLCDIAVIHGGQGSIQTAVSAGTPIIGFPIQPEQNFNLKLIEHHGAGICLSLRSLHKGLLKQEIEKIIKDNNYKKSMEQLQLWQSRKDGALEAAKIISDLIYKKTGYEKF
jgi:UDP:flavonoid glycosyltransferase YjiC (YdhE family)